MKAQSVRVDPEFRALIPPLTKAERANLEASILKEGRALDPIKAWRGIVVDGHNRLDICLEHSLPYKVDALQGFTNRDQVKAWMLAHQAARRSLTRDQALVLSVLRGVEPGPGHAPHEVDLAREAVGAGMADDLIAGRLTLRAAKNRLYPPVRAPRGPAATPHIPEGHELAGVSTLTDADGTVTGQWNKTRIHGAEEAPHEVVPEGHHVVQTSTMKRGDGTTAVQWVKVKPQEVERDAAFVKAMALHVEQYRGLAGVSVGPRFAPANLLNLIPIGDPHIGSRSWKPETGENYDTSIACRELLATVTELVEAAPEAEECELIQLGDFLHAEDDRQVTPGHGHKLDVDGRHAYVLQAGLALLRGLVDAALKKHNKVTIRNLPGNHDPRVATTLALWLGAVYENEPRVNVADAFSALQFRRFGKVLLGYTHGDRAKAQDLPALMAHHRAADWGETTERVWHCGHIHHKTRIETPGVIVETHRTMTAPDSYHAGRYASGRSLDVITYDAEYGEVKRNTVNLARMRAAIERGGA